MKFCINNKIVKFVYNVVFWIVKYFGSENNEKVFVNKFKILVSDEY